MIGLVLLALLQTSDDPAVTAALDQFKTDYKSKDVGQRAAAVGDLAKTSHDKIVAKLSALLVVDEPDVRIAAAKGLGGLPDFKRKGSLALAGAITPNLSAVPVAVAILEQLSVLKEELIAPEVEKHFAKTGPLDVQKAAIVASGKIRSVSSIDPLIKLLKELELEAQQNNSRIGGKVKGGAKGAAGKGGAAKNNNEERDRAMELLPAVRAALTAITTTTCQDAKDWEAWWNEHRGTFRVEK